LRRKQKENTFSNTNMTNCDVSWETLITTYLNYAVLMIFGYLRDWYRLVVPLKENETPQGYAPLLKSFEDFYTRRMYARIVDCFNRPIKSGPGAFIDVVKRELDYGNKKIISYDETINCLNLASYNYLGFAENPKHVTEDVFKSLDRYGVSTCSPGAEYGYTKVHQDLEQYIAKFVGKEAAIVFSMGYATNSTTIPAFTGKGDLIISDELNHSSIVSGARASGARIAVFKHNDMKSLEKTVRDAIVNGQPRTRRPWKKIIIFVEGIYSMEGEMTHLEEVVRIKKKYKCYLYVDEAHSIGAIGKTGRGICEHCCVDPADVDILMGTFTKGFGSMGGYVASSREIIQYLRESSYAPMYGSTMPVGCAQQALSALKVITGEDGTDIGQQKLIRLKQNANYFREGLRKLGFEVIGDEDSPVVIVMLYNPAKMPGFSRESLKRGLAVVVVGSPATEIIESRVRFCLSAAHTIEDLEKALQKLSEVGDYTLTKYKSFSATLKAILF
jgi:serine palmitoyltransferase